jgi:Tfp pilus assembly protein PilF
VSSQALTAGAIREVKSAFGYLAAGQPAQAFAIAQRLANAAPRSPDAQQLLALSCAALDRGAEADSAFRRALQLAPLHPDISLNYARFLVRNDRRDLALTVLSAASAKSPQHPALQRELGLQSLFAKQIDTAIPALRRSVELDPGQRRAWHGLGSALRESGALAEAEEAFTRALALGRDADLLANLAAVRRLMGRLDESISAYREALSLDPDRPALLDALVGALIDAGDVDAALAMAQQLTERHPDFAPGLSTRAHLHWEYVSAEGTAPDQALAFFYEAVARNPALTESLASFLLDARCGDAALALLAPLNDGSAKHRLSYALALESVKDPRADDVFASIDPEAVARLPAYFSARIRYWLRQGEIAQAARWAEDVARAEPRRQEAWALLATLWRLLGDEREYWLCGYDSLIGCAEVMLPDDAALGYAALSDWLHRLHTSRRAPSRQSLRGGSQTPGVLFGRPHRALQRFEISLRAVIENWLRSLPTDASHPFLSRKQNSVRFVGSWSVRLSRSDFHANHYHGDGWLSSACYIELPPAVRQANDHAGFLHFGQPPAELNLDLSPRRYLTPRERHVALFPSYLWHGTVPFDDPHPRLTVAFDCQPSS